MDPQLRQRLLGACVLVALAVLLVPVLLDGGYRETALNRRDLGPMPADDFPEQAERPPADVQAGIEAGMEADPGALGASLPPPAPREDKPREGGARAPTPASPNESATDRATRPTARASETPARSTPRDTRWAVQIAAFSARDNADALVKRLQAAGHKAYVLESREAGGTLFRVRAGPLPERSAALALRDRLAANPEFRGSLVRE